MKRRIIFLTGTRADFGKIKSLLGSLEAHPDFEPHLFVTGMHLLETYGYTLIEVERCGFKMVHTFHNHTSEATMELTLARTIDGFSKFVRDIKPDLVVVHGDRVEALAGAIVGSLNNILVAHIEGGELSGTIDELLRHATSKMSHIHFVANRDAGNRLLQMGESKESVVVIGSPDVDIMLSDSLPDIQEAKDHYEINFDRYGIVLFHPVTTEIEHMDLFANQFADALLQSDRNFVVIFPNNDMGSQSILDAYAKLRANPRFRIFPSIRFEYFLTLLKEADLIIGNSSAGIREAPYYGVPTINIGSRQDNRSDLDHIIHVDYKTSSIVKVLNSRLPKVSPQRPDFGYGNSNELFIKHISNPEFWEIRPQKQFIDHKDGK